MKEGKDERGEGGMLRMMRDGKGIRGKDERGEEGNGRRLPRDED